LLVKKTLPVSVTESLQSAVITLTSEVSVPLEVDGEWIGHLPATFSLERERLRVIVP
jgi:diacylglycerol kinase family enzyme